MNKLIIPIVVIIVIAVSISAYFVFQKSIFPNQTITNFEECVKADYPVLLTYPRQCKTPDGRFFKEEQAGSDKSVSYPQKFHVAGNKIVDEVEKEAVFRGVNIGSVITHAYYTEVKKKAGPKYVPWDENYFKQIDSFGAKIIRVNIAPEDFRTVPEGFSFDAIDRTLDWVSQQEMYVFITYHGIGFPPTEFYGEGDWELDEHFVPTNEEIFNFWDKISKRYKDNNVVAFYEIFNEPTRSTNKSKSSEAELEKDWLLWKDFSEQVIDIIRNNDPDSVIIVGGLNFAYDVSFALEDPIERENIVYATHPYPCKADKYKSWDEAFGVVKDKYPIFATEFTVSGLDGGPLDCESVRKELAKFVYLDDLAEEMQKYPGNKQKSHEISIEAIARIKENKTAFDYLISVREKYKKEIEEYLEDRKISWTGFIFYSIYPEFSMVDEDYTPTEQGEWFKQWLQEKNLK